MQQFNIIIIGGGAAGFFAAINIAEKHPQLSVAILERGKECLTKVKISGGGRCNGNAVTGRGGIGGFNTGWYHASSDLAATIGNSYMQDLSTGVMGYIRDRGRSWVNSVRPIRAFG